ncbi:WD repeat-containing protein 3 [Trichonephila clavata]|uniref:WD repeat-containing protein 3 n=1 Tax=Trichonephila clavata TaxID=2740835 RepID=A0A8X6JCG7_TRICU|nr:WD repeat-containing protein 3 [Trichonephila clavata]
MTTRQYLRVAPSEIFGVVGSSTANIIPLKCYGQNLTDNFFAVPACENVYLWNLRTREKNLVFNGEKSAVTCLVADSSHKNIAVGYADGVVRIFSVQDGSCLVSFIGHKTAVSCLTFEDGGSNLASGGKDSEIVIWNVTDETGLFRLKGHKGPISKCLFYQSKNCLISSSKDTYVKFWDLGTQHCFHTLIGSQYEILDIALIKGSMLVTGQNSQKLSLWSIFDENNDSDNSPLSKKQKVDSLEKKNFDGLFGDDEDEGTFNANFKAVELGGLPNLEIKTCSIVVDPNERVIGIHGGTKFIRLYKILKEEEIKKQFNKRKAKAKRKKNIAEDDNDDHEIVRTVEDEFQTLKSIECMSKVDSFCIFIKEDIAKITVLLKNNTIVQYELDVKHKHNDAVLCQSISIPGHRSFVRSLSCSYDGLSILSVGDQSAKIWRSFKGEQRCATTLPCNAALCSVFVPGNNHCILGTKNGKLDIFDIDKQTLTSSVDGHDGFVKCICLSPGQIGITSGGSDKEVKFWDFEHIRGDKQAESINMFTLALRRKLQMPEEILCVKYSPDSKRLAIALLDSTVQVLFADSLKLVFSLYGHEFPVTCLDISYDSTLIITGSNDRTIRIWSMEFGSCNKRLKIASEKDLPSDRGITCLQFMPKSHLFFSGSKDHIVRLWDADNFEKIITLRGHQDEITAMSVSPDGMYVVTASKDRSIRTWEKTKEPLVLEEEQENEAEEKGNEAEDLPVIPGEVNKEVALPGMKTPLTIKTVDTLIEALDLYKTEVEQLEDYKLNCEKAGKELPPPPVHPIFFAYRVNSPIEYMRKIVLRIKPSELEGALLHLPYNYVLDFLKVISEFAELGWETEFNEKCATFLVKIHFGQFLASTNCHQVIEKLRKNLFQQMYHIKDMVGFTKMVSNLHQRTIESREEVSMYTDLMKKRRRSRKKIQQPIVSFS